MSINIVSVTGRLVSDPEVRTASDTKVLSIRIAVDNQRKDKNGEYVNDPLFIDADYFTKGADKLAGYLHKGSQVGVSGSLRQDSWTNDKGEKRSKVLIRANNFEFLDPKDSDQQ